MANGITGAQPHQTMQAQSSHSLRIAIACSTLSMFLSGCGYLLRSPDRPTPAIHYRWTREHATLNTPCLLVLLPGFLDSPEDFHLHGLVGDLHSLVPNCDLVAVATHLYDYYDRSIVPRIHEDIIVEGRHRGYEQVWVVGISMGAIAAVLTAREHPSDVDGLILISPYLGTASFMNRFREEVRAHGNLASWAAAADEGSFRIERILHDPRPIWRWLVRHHITEAGSPPLYLAYAHGDRFAPAQRLLAQWTAPERAFTADGGHDWQTWRRLFLEVIAAEPPELMMLGRRCAGDFSREPSRNIGRW
jgi:pimeloyl-ACP methyl ester carboxylesterase